MNQPSVLLVQPNMQPPGGAQCVSAWGAQALQADYAVEALTWIPLQVSEINRFYGTTLDAAKIKNFHPPAWLRALFTLDPDPNSAQRLAVMTRAAKWMRRHYDLVISFCDEIDVGAPAMQYVHYSYLTDLYRREQELRARGGRHILELSLRPWRIISGFSFERMRKNYTLVNSDWTGKHFTESYAASTHTVYPPVTGNFKKVPWAERENGFVCIGRIQTAKRYEDMIAILAELRVRGHNLHLHIIGSLLSQPLDVAYYQGLERLIQTHRAWVSLHKNISRVELEELVVQYRYGIHAMRAEHFGIAPAELVRAGCIVFVFNDGGQVEIVGEEPRLRYHSLADAADKIERVLEDDKAQSELSLALAARAQLFSPERFMHELRTHVTRYLAAPTAGPDSAS